MQTGRERLAQYRDRSRLKQYELARLIGVTDSYLSQLLSGRRKPGRDIAIRIEAQTGIPVQSWSDIALSDLSDGHRRRVRKPHIGAELR